MRHLEVAHADQTSAIYEEELERRGGGSGVGGGGDEEGVGNLTYSSYCVTVAWRNVCDAAKTSAFCEEEKEEEG